MFCILRIIELLFDQSVFSSEMRCLRDQIPSRYVDYYPKIISNCLRHKIRSIVTTRYIDKGWHTYLTSFLSVPSGSIGHREDGDIPAGILSSRVVEPPEARVQYIVDPSFPTTILQGTCSAWFRNHNAPRCGRWGRQSYSSPSTPPPPIQKQPKSRCLGRKYSY